MKKNLTFTINIIILSFTLLLLVSCGGKFVETQINTDTQKEAQAEQSLGEASLDSGVDSTVKLAERVDKKATSGDDGNQSTAQGFTQ